MTTTPSTGEPRTIISIRSCMTVEKRIVVSRTLISHKCSAINWGVLPVKQFHTRKIPNYYESKSEKNKYIHTQYRSKAHTILFKFLETLHNKIPLTQSSFIFWNSVEGICKFNIKHFPCNFIHYIFIILLHNSAEADILKEFSWHGRRGICIIKM
jgi:hypothetical protein